MPEQDLADKKSRAAKRRSEEMSPSKRTRDEFREAKLASRMASTRGPEMIGEHTVASGETLSHIAVKYYGSSVKEKWMAIYKANKETIGEDPGLIKPGQVLSIPKLPE